MTEITKPASTQPLTWSRFTFPGSLYKYGTLLFVLVFLTYSLNFMNVSIPKMLGALGGLVGVIADRYYPPDLAYVTNPGYLASVVDTLQMSFLGGIAGVFLSIPLAWFSAANVSPNRKVLFPIGRMGVISCRAIHETIWTILFVSVLGFGMLAGVSALTMFCIGFAGKPPASDKIQGDPWKSVFPVFEDSSCSSELMVSWCIVMVPVASRKD